ncbi:methylenetetrahydrofolate reductase [Microbacterium sp. LMI12-1-1.1]|uniref:methylenetetrahydrofolate reductase n=1 Tax=Microbacterium sp. LMI12-1-1.1 TaxID=3135225 RepID=UPI0034144BBB
MNPESTLPGSAELIRDYSLEMTGKDVEELRAARETIPDGTRINVTFLGNEDLEMRVAAARAVRESGFMPVPHIAARRIPSRAHLAEFLSRLHDVGAAQEVFVVGGDPASAEGPFEDAQSIIDSGLLEEYGVQGVTISGYPEGHPDITTALLWRALDQKVASLSHRGFHATILTQLAFDTAPVAEWIAATRSKGIEVDIRVGTPGPAGVKRLIGFARRFGIGANALIVKKYGFSLTNLMGTAGPDRFVDGLADALALTPMKSDVKLHFYTFGGLRATSDWVHHYEARTRANGADHG